MMHRAIIFYFIISTCCASAFAAPLQYSRKQGLTEEEAKYRAHVVSRVRYQLEMDLSRGARERQETYFGKMNLQFQFNATRSAGEVAIDLKDADISVLELNGKKQKVATHSDSDRIYFRPEELRSGLNTVLISYSHDFSESGMGLYRAFGEKRNGDVQGVYLYTNLEPFHANEVFPCFDQPDLKATFELSVKAPSEWEVISNEREDAVRSLSQKQKLWHFSPTPPLSTYLYAIHAGTYAKWQGAVDVPTDTGSKKIPLRLFARSELSSQVTPDEWLTVTAQGVELFSSVFGIPFPYSKYDQILVPDFGTSGMENAGATTLSEDYLYRGLKPTVEELRRRDYLILHELVHMWFGNLVSVRWWDGLWLNEGFASFFGTWGLEKLPVTQGDVSRGAWPFFFLELKGWAAGEDQYETTHAVQQKVASTLEARATFDAMTYGKGAAVLKELFYSLGESKFLAAVRQYLKRFAGRSATTRELLLEFESVVGPLGQWAQDWLKTPGINTLHVQFQCKEGKLTQLALEQGNTPLSTTLRTHHTQLGFYRFVAGDSKPVEPYQILGVDYHGERTELVAQGECPDFIYPNVGDLDYVRVLFDTPQKFVLYDNLSRFADPLTRLGIWSSLWEDVLNGQLTPSVYAEFGFKHLLDKERDLQILGEYLGTLGSSSARKQSVLKFLHTAREPYWLKLDGLLRQKFISQVDGSVEQLFWFHPFVDMIRSPESQELALMLLEGKLPLSKSLSFERRWLLINALARQNHAQAEVLIIREIEQMGLEGTKKAASIAFMSRPVAQSKQKWLESILTLGKLHVETAELPSIPEREAAAENWPLVGQEEYVTLGAEPFFQTLIDWNAEKMDLEAFSYFVDWMYPPLCTEEGIKRTSDILEQTAHKGNLPPEVIKSVKNQRQDSERCVRARLAR